MAYSLEEALQIAKTRVKQGFIVGGAAIYKALPLQKHITRVLASIEVMFRCLL